MKKKIGKFIMPGWMENYRQYFTEPNRVEEYANCDGVNCNIVVNGPRALMCQTSSSERGILFRLQKAGIIK